ncbi:MAG: cytochrome c [Bacteroidia bacterium]|nr:cytochrome c [Bacteroidia bacterium]
MKKLIIVIAASAVFAACKSKKAAGSTNMPVVTDKQLSAVQARFPDANRAELEKGHSVYTGACTKCHGAKDVTTYTEPKLLEIVEVMSKKANITPEEKQALVRFAVGVRSGK